MKHLAFLGSVVLSLGLVACGPTATPGNGGDDSGSGGPDANPGGPCTPSGVENTPQTCSDGVDQDCDGKIDCSDPDCSGIGNCPVCGQVNTPTGGGVVLPDGIIGTSCTSDAQCGGSTPNCVENECHGSYDSTLNFIGFGQNQTFTDASNIVSVCVNIEHSWMRDMEIQLEAPNGVKIRLQKFAGRNGGEVYLGQANDCDEGNPMPGTGATYCWKPTATNPGTIAYADSGAPMATSPTCSFGTATELPPGDYSADDPWNNLVGAPLNGTWKIVVTDLWPIDNGFIFSWQITWDPNLVSDCSGPIIGFNDAPRSIPDAVGQQPVDVIE